MAESYRDNGRAGKRIKGLRRSQQTWAFALVAVLALSCRDESPEATAPPERTTSAITSAAQLRQVNGDGFGDPNNIGIDRVHATQGYLFAGTWNDAEGMIVYRSRDGTNFEQISQGGVDGNRNNFVVVSFAWFNGKLYTSSWNAVDGGSVFRANATAADPSDIVWETISTSGLGNPRNEAHHGFSVFAGHLYAGTFNFAEGTEIWRTASGNPGTWRQAAPKAFGDSRNTDAANSVARNGSLYVGIETARLPFAGARIMRTNGSGWQQVNVDGFGDNFNHNIIAMEFFNGDLYAGTWNESGTQVWRATPGPSVPFSNWQQVNEDGFGASAVNGASTINGFSNFMVANGQDLYVVGQDTGQSRGFVFKTIDGTTWEEVTGPGWSPTGSAAGAYWATVFQGRVYVGFHQGDGPGSLWVIE
jgi:hypothetical protein